MHNFLKYLFWNKTVHLHCCTVHCCFSLFFIVVPCIVFSLFFIVVPCMLFQSSLLLYHALLFQYLLHCTVHVVSVSSLLLYRALLFQSLLYCCTVHVVSVSSLLLYRALLFQSLLHCTVHCCFNLFFIVVPCIVFLVFSSLLYRACCFNLFFIVVPCTLFESLLYCSNSCTLLHFKTLKSHTKILSVLV